MNKVSAGMKGRKMTTKQLDAYKRTAYRYRNHELPELMEIVKHTAITLYDSDGTSPRGLSPDGYRMHHRVMVVCVNRIIELTGGKF
jgi:hypothetical protein